jgi:hemolysin activation/secretion protein
MRIYDANAAPRATRLCILAFLLLKTFFSPFVHAQQDPAASARVLVQRFNFTGNYAVATSDLNSIAAPFVGKELNLTEIQAIAARITEEYRSRGYALAKAYIPQQEITAGAIEIAVLEGQLGTIEVRGNNFYSADFIRRHFTIVVEEEAIKRSSLEKALLILNDHRDIKATMTLRPGKEPGTTDLIVDVKESFPLHLSLDYNNFGSSAVSRNRFGAELEVAKFLPIEGSLLSIRGVMGSKASDFAYGRTAFTVPVNDYGTRAALFAFGGDFDVGQEFKDLDIKGQSWGYGIALSQSFIKTRFHSLSGEVGFESEDTKEFLLNTLSSRDRIRSLKAGVDFSSIDGTGRSGVSFAIKQGLGDSFGAMKNHDPKSSRLLADNRFSLFSLNAARLQRITDLLSVLLRASGQATTRSLVASEQFALGGADTVRGYPQGEFLGDHGYSVSTEFRVYPLPQWDILQLAFFVDHGGVAVRESPAGSRSYHNLTGVGYGLRIAASYRSLAFHGRFDVGFPVQPSKSSSDQRPMLYILVVASF